MTISGTQLTAIGENARALADAWWDAGIGGGDTAYAQAVIGYADESWGNPDALAAGLLASTAILVSWSKQLDQPGTHHSVYEQRGLMSAYLTMFNLLLNHADPELGNYTAASVHEILNDDGYNMGAKLINRAEVPNR